MRAGPPLALALLAASCAHPSHLQPAQPLERPVYIPESIAGPVVEALDEATGLRIGAVTAPGLPPLIFDQQPDACELEHEARHQLQEVRDGSIRWSARYVSSFLKCWAPARRREDFVRCYHAIPYEVDAFAVQEACMLARAPGGGPS